MLRLHRDAVLDPDAHASEMFRPAVCVGDVDPAVWQCKCKPRSNEQERTGRVKMLTWEKWEGLWARQGGRAGRSGLRLHGHAVACLEDFFARVAGRVVHVEADVVA